MSYGELLGKLRAGELRCFACDYPISSDEEFEVFDGETVHLNNSCAESADEGEQNA